VSADVGGIELVAPIERQRYGSDLSPDRFQSVASEREHGRDRHCLVPTIAEHEGDEKQGVHPAHSQDDIIGSHIVSVGDERAEPRIALSRAVAKRDLTQTRLRQGIEHIAEPKIWADALAQIVARYLSDQRDDVILREPRHLDSSASQGCSTPSTQVTAWPPSQIVVPSNSTVT
jgi:hypothetical protein